MSRGRPRPGSLFVNLLGGLRVAAPGAENVLPLERKKTRAVLAVLATEPGKMVSRARLTALLWADQSPDIARHGLRQCLLDLRHALSRGNVDAIRTESDAIALDRSSVVVDVACFGELIRRGTAEALTEAMDLYHGDLLEGFSLEEPAFEEWLQVERERLRSQAVGVLRKLLTEHVRDKATDAAVHVAARLLTFEPFEESVHRTLMRLYADSGRRSAALRQYEACVELLGRELGVEPEAETRDLYRGLIADRSTAGRKAPTGRSQRKPPMRTTRVLAGHRSPAMSPLIGREADFAWLDALWRDARTGAPQVALILGEAGIGKSRFVSELASLESFRGADFLLGRSREGEDVLAFAPWVEALRPVLSDDVLAQLPAATRLDLARIVPEIADGPGPLSTGIEDGPRIFEGVAVLLRLLTAARPLVVVIEDLHWSDDMTLRLLRFLPRRLQGRPVLLLGTARLEEIGDGRGVILDALRHEAAHAARTLAPLSRDQTIDLFRAIVAARADSSALGDRVWQLSEGNPFVVVECARTVRDGLTSPSPDVLELPDEVRTLTTRYLAALSDKAARLADVAAVIGRDFDVSLLRHVVGSSDSEVADGIEELVRRRVVREIGDRFDFRHDRVREAAYGRLLSPRRTLLHRQVARGLEAMYAHDLGPHCAAIGTHYRHATDWQEACSYLERAGHHAWERGAGREALSCFEDALDASAKLPDSSQHTEIRIRLRLQANGAAIATSSYERGRRHLHEADRLAAEIADRRWQGRVAAVLSNSYRPAGELDRARRLGETTLEIGQETQDRWLESVGRLLVGQVAYNVGNYRRAMEHLSAVLSAGACDHAFTSPFFPAVDRPASLRVAARFFMVYVCAQLGDLAVAQRVVDDAFRESDTQGDPLGSLRIGAYMALGRVHYGYGDFEAAVHAYENALALYREDCHRTWYRPLSWDLALSYALSGRASDGIRVLERYDATERALGSNAFRDCYLVHLGRVLLEAGRLDDAGRTCDEALAVSRRVGARGSEAAALALLAEVVARRCPAQDDVAERHLQNALRLADELEMRPLVARCHERLAWLCERGGNPTRQRHHATTARSLSDEMRIVDLAGAGMH